MFPIFPTVNLSGQRRKGTDVYEKRQILKFQMGITGVPFGRTELVVPPLETQERKSCSGEGSQGAWD